MKIKEIIDKVKEESLKEKLRTMYCLGAGESTEYYEKRILHVAEGLKEQFHVLASQEAVIASAAGRTEIGGNHTDHQRGKVLTGSVDLDAIACAAVNGTSRIRIFSEGFGLTEVDLKALEPVKEEENTTASLIRGIAARITLLGYELSGFDAYMVSDVPGGSGLSSSACFEVLVGVIINRLFCDNAISMVDIAKTGQYAENVYFGKPSGLMDQMGCAVGGMVTIDFRDAKNPVFHKVDFDFAQAGYNLCIVDSGASHADLTGDYAAIPAEMRAVAGLLGKEVLSEVPEETFLENIPRVREALGDRAFLRAMHYYADCARVEKEVASLEAGDFAGFLALVNESGDSSFKYLQNIATFRDSKEQPVAAALCIAGHALSGTGACRVHGGGFAGTIQAFVPVAKTDRFKREVEAVCGAGACRVTRIRPVGGCIIL